MARAMKYAAALFAVCVLAASPAAAFSDPDWLAQLQQQALNEGVSAQTVHAALDAFEPDERVVELDRKQPEGTATFANYRRNIVSPARVAKGVETYRRHEAALRAAEARTGVPAAMIVALWGIESTYGRFPGNFETVTSLATLAYEGRRATFFRGELMAALKIIDRLGIAPSQLRGSWAGAMGQCQFMPSTYLRSAADGDGDGTADIWANADDVIASIAAYLAAEGWKADMIWGREVGATALDASYVGLDQVRDLAEWARLGVTNPDGTPLPRRQLTASLIRPDGENGPSFLVYDNFRAVMRWNKSTYFATSAGLLADAIRAAK